jgi:hypothetical protein
MKRFLTTILVLTMVFSLFTIPVSANPAGDWDVDGNIISLPHVIEVTLPTTKFTFTVDPEGVLPGGSAGDVKFDNGTPVFINRSSTTIELGIEASIKTNGATSGTAGDIGVAIVSDAGSVGNATSTTRNAYVSVTPSDANVAATSAVFDGTANVTALTAAPQLLTFALPAAKYNVTGTPAVDGIGTLKREIDAAAPALQGTQIKLEGNVTPNPAIWNNDVNFAVVVKFSFKVAEPSLIATAQLGASTHLKTIAPGTVFASLPAGPPPASATATIAPVGGFDVITITATGFTFPTNGAGITATALRGTTAGISGNDIVAITPTAMTGGGAALVVTLNAGWTTGGTNQNATGASWFQFTWGGNTVRVNKTAANATGVSGVTVTLAP